MDEITEPRASANPRSEPTLAGSGPAPRNREVDTLSAVSAQVYRAPDVPTLLRTALAELLGGLGLTAGWIFLGDKAEEGLHLAAAQGLSALYVEQVSRTGLLTCLCHEVFATGYNMVAHNTKQCPRMPHLLEDDAAPVAHACVPLQLEGRSRGVLNVVVEAPAWRNELVFIEAEIVRRVNARYKELLPNDPVGPPVKKLRLSVGALPAPPAPPPPKEKLRAATDVEARDVDARLAEVKDPEVRDAARKFLLASLRAERAERANK